jgi:hypothetical protein
MAFHHGLLCSGRVAAAYEHKLNDDARAMAALSASPSQHGNSITAVNDERVPAHS